MITEHTIRELFDPKYKELFEYKKWLRSYQKKWLVSISSAFLFSQEIGFYCSISYSLLGSWYVGIPIAILNHLIIMEITFRWMVRDEIKRMYK